MGFRIGHLTVLIYSSCRAQGSVVMRWFLEVGRRNDDCGSFMRLERHASFFFAGWEQTAESDSGARRT
jgi:hypothetical protein